jgi:hypothetical protein
VGGSWEDTEFELEKFAEVTEDVKTLKVTCETLLGFPPDANN